MQKYSVSKYILHANQGIQGVGERLLFALMRRSDISNVLLHRYEDRSNYFETDLVVLKIFKLTYFYGRISVSLVFTLKIFQVHR